MNVAVLYPDDVRSALSIIDLIAVLGNECYNH